MQLYYLENRTSPHNVAYFWRKGGCGYTSSIRDAEKFTAEHADALIKSAEGSHRFIKHAVEAVNAAAYLAVNIDDLPAIAKAKEQS